MYIPYSGWGLLRGPDTALGDVLARRSPDTLMWAGRVVAVLGMALWCWPLAAFVVSVGVRGLNAGVLEALRLESGSWMARWWETARLLRGALGAGVGCVALVVAGSAVPLHVAQVPTYAIELWRAMQLGRDACGVWLAGAPLLAVAGVGAWVIGRRVWRGGENSAPGTEGGEASGLSGWMAAGVWAVTVLGPLGLFVWSLRSWSSVGRFWPQSGAGVARSAEVAAVVGVVVAALALATWACVADGRVWARRAAAFALQVMLFGGLAPGVLVGLACAQSWGRVGWVGESAAVIVVAHAARFGFVGVLAGWWLARAETREERWMRELDAGRSALGWWRARVMGGGVVSAAGAGVCAGALSLHEIEATVMVAPPGRQNLAQQVLDMLHYARDEQLSAAAVNILGIGVVVAALGVVMLWWGRFRSSAVIEGPR